MRRIAAIAAALAVSVAGCTGTPPTEDRAGAAGFAVERPVRPSPHVDAPSPPPAPEPRAVRLTSFSGCPAFLSYVREKGAEAVGPWGLPGPAPFGVAGLALAAGGTADGSAAAPAAAPARAGIDFSETNVQEAGVDEPDLVKTDGRRILAIAGGRLHMVLAGSTPRLAGSLALPVHGHEMLLAGDRALVLASGAPHVRPAAVPWRNESPGSTIVVVDVADPARMRVVSTLQLQGTVAAARMVDGVARVVLRSGPSGLRFRFPSGAGSDENETATRRNRDTILRSTLDNWLPRYVLEERRGGAVRRRSGRAAACERLWRPAEPSGFGTVTVLTIDPRDPRPDAGASVAGDAQTVYASAKTLYVAAQPPASSPQPRPTVAGLATAVHAFDISSARGARYLGSGAVAGRVLNQWSISEHEGRLRVATTVGEWDARRVSQSFVHVLERRGSALVTVGAVGGLGEGERIYAVRFIGDVGYVVTFRQIDPLYVVDLADPTRPRVAGELKIPGYSSYLHPVGDGLVLGIGRDGTEDGLVTGAQASLFDVSDPAAPRRIDQFPLGDGTDVEGDHHAFLWWPATRTAAIPFVRWNEGNDSGVVALRVDRGGIRLAGRATHRDRVAGQDGAWLARILRSVVVGGTLHTVSEKGLLSSDLSSLEERDWLAWEPGFATVRTEAGSARGVRDGAREHARFDRPGQMALAPDGGVWIADEGNRRVRHMDAGGHVRTPSIWIEGEAGPRQDFRSRTTGVAVSSDGTLWVSTACALWRVRDPSGAQPVARRVAGPPLEGGACDGDARPVDGAGPAARFGGARHIAAAADGSIVVADAGAHAIRRVVVDAADVGTVTTIAGSLGEAGFADGAASEARFSAPGGIAALADGTSLVADTGNKAVRRIDPSGAVGTVASSEPHDPNLGSRQSEPVWAPLEGPNGIAHDIHTDTTYVTDGAAPERDNAVIALDARGASVVAGSRERGAADGAIGRARFDAPAAVLPLGRDVLVADAGNHRLRRIVYT